MSSAAMVAGALECQASEIALHYSLATRRAVNLALKNNLSVVIWTTDDPEWGVRAREMGIALMTNDPGQMILTRPT
jgi:glycerophosphoryl diester phosphodiesterase